MRVAVCDDEQLYLDAITACIDRWIRARDYKNIVVDRYNSTDDLLDAHVLNPSIDIVFLDIQFPNDMSGLDLAKRIRSVNEIIHIVFITNYLEYACEGYNVNALRYLHKPVQDYEIFECLDITYKQYRMTQFTYLHLASKREKFIIPHRNILYIESVGHNLLIHSVSGELPIETRMRISEMLDDLPSDIFMQCHRSFVLNIMYIRKITRTHATIANGAYIPISKKYIGEINNIFDNYYQGVNV